MEIICGFKVSKGIALIFAQRYFKIGKQREHLFNYF
jgi:hypothetical protein